MAQFRGVFTIPVTPFDRHGNIDEDSLKNEVNWCVLAGAHGIVAPVNASESPTLTDDERKRVTRLVIESADKRVPVIIGVSGVSQQSAVLYARYARQVGADGVIAMPPYGVRLIDPESIFAFYQAVGDTVEGLPVFIQNWSGPAGTTMSAAQLTRLVQEIDNVSYIKEETANASHMMTEIIGRAGDALEGVMGGVGGRFLLDEFRRGACGTMPACQVTDVHVTIWNALEAGNLDKARRTFNRLLPLLNMEAAFAGALYKEVLRRRGVIATATMRGRRDALDQFDHQELDAILRDVSELYSI